MWGDAVLSANHRQHFSGFHQRWQQTATHVCNQQIWCNTRIQSHRSVSTLDWALSPKSAQVGSSITSRELHTDEIWSPSPPHRHTHPVPVNCVPIPDITLFDLYQLFKQLYVMPSVLWRCWLGGTKGIRPVKKSGGVLVLLSVWSKVDLHMAQLMPLPLTVSCFTKNQIGFTFLVLAHLGSPGKRAVKRVCVCAVCNALVWKYRSLICFMHENWDLSS